VRVWHDRDIPALAALLRDDAAANGQRPAEGECQVGMLQGSVNGWFSLPAVSLVPVVTGVGERVWATRGTRGRSGFVVRCGGQAQQAALVGERDGLDAVPQAEFGQYPGEVGLHGLLTEVQLCRDLPVGEVSGDQPEHVDLPFGECGQCSRRPVVDSRCRGERLDDP
jgi:hypothetical protein